MTRIHHFDPGDAQVRLFLTQRGHGVVARAGELVDPFQYPSVVAEDDGDLVGVLTYVVAGNECEILTLHAAAQWSGVGSALLQELRAVATELRCTRLRVTTTNDNVDALRFYQRRGFRLAELRRGAVDAARLNLKPAIPAVGAHGIPLRDELELTQDLLPTGTVTAAV